MTKQQNKTKQGTNKQHSRLGKTKVYQNTVTGRSVYPS